MDYSDPCSGTYSANHVLQNGDIDVTLFRDLMSNCPYMMDLDGAKEKQDSEMEEQALGYFTPLWSQLKFTQNAMEKNFKGLLERCTIPKNNKNDKLIPTHTGMDGGNFHIPIQPLNPEHPNDNEEHFLKFYAYWVLQGKKIYLTERYSQPIFRYFMDLDFVQPESLTAFQVEIIVYVVNQVVKRFWEASEDTFRLICCTTTWKQNKCTKCLCSCVNNNTYATPIKSCSLCHGTGCTGKNKLGKPCEKCKGIHPVRKKTGIHIIWPHLFVTDTMCLDIRESILSDCIKLFGQRSDPFNDWDEVVDKAVYGNNGLRMIGSRKVENCPACNKKDSSKCKLCREYGGYGRIDTGRPYGPLFVADGKGKRDLIKEQFYKNDYYQLILDTKIRSDLQEPTPGFRIPEGAPTYTTLNEKDKKRKETKSPTRHARVLLNTPEAEQLQKWFKTCPQPKYTDLIITKLMKSSKAQSKYLVIVTGSNCTYCQNVGRCHKSNRIYFEVEKNGVSQRCHDTAEILDSDMKYGLCKDYKSAPMDLTTSLRNLLFPTVEDENASMLSESQKFSTVSKASEIKIQSLLNAGNRLCRELYNIDWTSSTRFAAANGDRLLEFQTHMFKYDRMLRTQSIYKSFIPNAIGSKDETLLLRELHFQPSIVPVHENSILAPPRKKLKVSSDADKLKDDKTNIVDLQDELHQIIKNIINICLNTDEVTIVQTLKEKGLQGIGRGIKITKKKLSEPISKLFQIE